MNVFLKRSFIFTIISVMLMSFCVNAEDYVKIGLKYGSTAVNSCVVSSGTSLTICSNGEYISQNTLVSVTLTVENGLISIYSADNTLIYTTLTPEQSVEIVSYDGIVALNQKKYRGTMIFTLYNGNSIQVVNFLEVEDYLKSVVPSEMPGSWNIEALKAQAICARNYTYLNKNRYSKYGFDMDNTTACQAYNGVESEYPNSTNAVTETKGQILLYNNAPAELFYSSSSGGYTEDVKNVWGSTNYPYLISVEDPYDNNYTWEVTFTKEEIKTRVEKYGKAIGDITNVEITEKTPAGRAKEVVITGTEGTYTLKLESTRNFFNLKSAMYEIIPSSTTAPQPVKQPNYISVLTSKGTETREFSGKIITATGTKEILPVETTPTVVSGADSYTFSGKGYGHGIGMSQYGAKGFADNGYNYQQILSHYFSGTTLGYAQ